MKNLRLDFGVHFVTSIAITGNGNRDARPNAWPPIQRRGGFILAVDYQDACRIADAMRIEEPVELKEGFWDKEYTRATEIVARCRTATGTVSVPVDMALGVAHTLNALTAPAVDHGREFDQSTGSQPSDLVERMKKRMAE